MVATVSPRPPRTVVTVEGLIVDPTLRYDPAAGHPGYEIHGSMVAVSPAALHLIPRQVREQATTNSTLTHA